MNKESKDKILGPAVDDPTADVVIRTCTIRDIGRQDFKSQRAERDLVLPAGVEPQSRGTWDFVLTYGDGHVVHLHPEYRGTRVAANVGTPPVDDEVPRAGRGGSDGRGTFSKFKHKGYNATLRFGR